MPSGEHPPLRWETPTQFMKELKKLGLSKDEGAKVTVVMKAFAEGRAKPRDQKTLRDEVEELRIDGNRRTFRIYFTRVEAGLVLLCLHAHSKKKDRDRDAVDLAVARRRAYLDGRWP